MIRSAGKLFGSVGERVITAVPWILGLLVLAAVTVTVAAEAIEAGAVYRPVEVMDPRLAGVIDQFTVGFVTPGWSAVNCRACRADRAAVSGNTSMELAGTISMALMIGAAPLIDVNAMAICPLLTDTGIVVSQGICGPPALAHTSTRSKAEFVWPLTATENRRLPGPHQLTVGSANFKVTR